MSTAHVPAGTTERPAGRPDAVIHTEDLTKVYPGTDFAAVDRLNLDVAAGEIFGLLGPNGAGKTTTAGMLTTRVVPTSGRAYLAGVDVAAHPALAKQLSGIVSQQNTLDRQLTVWENLYFHGRLFGMGARASRRTADELLAQFQLSRWAGASVYALSGGMAQRLMVARAIFHRPSVLFLDEPTAGLDRRAGWPCGICSASCTAAARPSCSPRITWKRRTSCVTGWPSWTTAASWRWTPRPR
jgi:ABC-2 type transport system ATP-binding protein